MTPQDWMYLFGALDSAGSADVDALTWARDYAVEPEKGWAECPRADWMSGAAARAGLPDRDLVAVITDMLSQVFEKRAESGAPTPPDIERALRFAEAWSASEMGTEDVHRAYDEEHDACTSRLAQELIDLTARAANRVAMGPDEALDDLALVWSSIAVSRHAGNVLRAVALNASLQSLFANLVRAYIPWETLAEAATTSVLSLRRRRAWSEGSADPDAWAKHRPRW